MKQKRRVFLAAVLALAFSASMAMVICQQVEYHRMEADRQEARRIAGLSSTPSPPPVPQSTATPVPDPAPEPRPKAGPTLEGVDLDALRAVNSDVTGWILIPDTELSYPLVQGKDNQYYLNHNWKKEQSGGGAVFLESTCAADLSGFHTIVYAHRMRGGAMFGTLKYYDSPDYWREHPSVYVVTGNGVSRYDVFSAHEVGIQETVYRLDIETRHLEEELIRYCLEGTAFDTGIIPTADDQIITLSTCTQSGGYARRWAVHAVLRESWAAG